MLKADVWILDGHLWIHFNTQNSFETKLLWLQLLGVLWGSYMHVLCTGNWIPSAFQPGNGRAYLNVVDIGGDVLDDIVAAIPEKHPAAKKKPKRRKVKLKVDRQEEQEDDEEEQEAGPDALTADMLGQRPGGVG